MWSLKYSACSRSRANVSVRTTAQGVGDRRVLSRWSVSCARCMGFWVQLLLVNSPRYSEGRAGIRCGKGVGSAEEVSGSAMGRGVSGGFPGLLHLPPLAAASKSLESPYPCPQPYQWFGSGRCESPSTWIPSLFLSPPLSPEYKRVGIHRLM